MSKAKITVKQNEEAPVEKIILAEAIANISKATKALLAIKAIVILLQAKTGCSRRAIEDVLEGLEQLQAAYTVKK